MSQRQVQLITSIIRQRRKQFGYSQAFMAGQMHIAQNRYRLIEQGDVKLTLEQLLHICLVLDIQIADLLAMQMVVV